MEMLRETANYDLLNNNRDYIHLVQFTSITATCIPAKRLQASKTTRRLRTRHRSDADNWADNKTRKKTQKKKKDNYRIVVAHIYGRNEAR